MLFPLTWQKDTGPDFSAAPVLSGHGLNIWGVRPSLSTTTIVVWRSLPFGAGRGKGKHTP